MEQRLFPYSSEMAKILYDAALNNDVPTLSHLLIQDPNLLERANFNCEDKNPLHIAVMQGHLEFVQEILKHKGSFCMCLSRDRDGRNPVHLAAMYGQLNILKLLMQHDTPLIEAALEKADRGGTMLHLCVKHNQLEALKLLLEIFTDPEFVCTNNDDGMTILHLAIYYNQNQSKRREMITYLIENTGTEMVNIKNANGKTALDLVLEQGKIRPSAFLRVKGRRKKLNHLLSRSNAVDLQILRSLAEAGALTGCEAVSSQEEHNKELKWLETRGDVIMVVAALIATMAFQAMVNPPGGVWQEDSLEGPNQHRAGEAVLAKTHPKYFRHLIRASTVAFVSSLSTIIVLIRGFRIISTLWFYLLSTIIWLSMAAIGITYAISLEMVAPESERGRLSITNAIVVVVIIVWGCNAIKSAWQAYKNICFSLLAQKNKPTFIIYIVKFEFI